jgi:hypothetical protein
LSAPFSAAQDELFHVRQTQQYCRGDFATWDPMITTFPGLYLFAVGILQTTAALLGQSLVSSGSWLCSAPMLRLVNPLFGLLVFFCSADIIDSLGRQPTRSTSTSGARQPAYAHFKQLKASRGTKRRDSVSPAPTLRPTSNTDAQTVVGVDGTWGALTLSLCPLHFFFIFLL